MPALRNYHIFISHAWDYNDDYQTIKRWLNETPYFLWTDNSVPITRPLPTRTNAELRKELRERIATSSCVIILAGMYAAYSEWIDYEMVTAAAYEKPIIAVIPWAQERIPIKIQQCACTMIHWQSSSVVQAVRDYAIDRTE